MFDSPRRFGGEVTHTLWSITMFLVGVLVALLVYQGQRSAAPPAEVVPEVAQARQASRPRTPDVSEQLEQLRLEAIKQQLRQQDEQQEKQGSSFPEEHERTPSFVTQSVTQPKSVAQRRSEPERPRRSRRPSPRVKPSPRATVPARRSAEVQTPSSPEAPAEDSVPRERLIKPQVETADGEIVPSYEVLHAVREFNSDRLYGEVLVPSLSAGTDKGELRRIAKAIAKQEAYSSLVIYCDERARRARYSMSFADRHPNALRNGLLCFIERGWFRLAEPKDWGLQQ